MNDIEVYELTENIPYEEITQLLNRAFAELKEQKLDYAAASQTPEVTKARIDGGSCVLARVSGQLVGTMSYHICHNEGTGKWYEDDTYISFSQMAIDPDYRNNGVMMEMMKYLMIHVLRDKEIKSTISDTSMKADHLVKTYVKTGMQIVDVISWPGTNYYSYVFRRALRDNRYPDELCRRRVRQAYVKCVLKYTRYGKKRFWYKVYSRIRRK